MSRTTATTRSSRAKLALEVTVERDESSGYRHEWTTTVQLGLYRGRGRNLREALDALSSEIHALAHSPAAETGLAVERAAEGAVYQREAAELGAEQALERMRTRARGIDPDAPIETST